MNIFISMSEAKVLESIKTVINKYFHIENIKFCSFAMASFTVSRDMFVHQESFMLVNIGGEITDISMIKKMYYVNHFHIRWVVIFCTQWSK